MRSFSSYPSVRQEVRAERCGDLSARAEVPIGNCRRPYALHRPANTEWSVCLRYQRYCCLCVPHGTSRQWQGRGERSNLPDSVSFPIGWPGSLKDRAVLLLLGGEFFGIVYFILIRRVRMRMLPRLLFWRSWYSRARRTRARSLLLRVAIRMTILGIISNQVLPRRRVLRGHLLDVEPASHRRYFPNLVWTPTSCAPIGGISVSDQGWISCRRNGDIACGAPLEAR
jgi:hypothetical protein